MHEASTIMQAAILPKRLMESDLFDADWYQSRYADVASSGLTSIQHFLRFGMTLDRDPSAHFSSTFYRHVLEPDDISQTHPLTYCLDHPDAEPVGDLVLHACMQMLNQGSNNQALHFAHKYLPVRLRHTHAAILANIACLNKDDHAWQSAMNTYLQFYGLAPLHLRPAAHKLNQLQCNALKPVIDGPLITVIVPVWNAQSTIATALKSLLEQTWRPLEIIVVDDCSTDSSWTTLQEIAARDDRVKLLRNIRNVGPYVSKNIGLKYATGAYVTGHDADDWAHPERLATHMQIAINRPDPMPVSMPYCLRMQPSGFFNHIKRAGRATSYDGWMQSAPIGTLFEASFLKNRLGYWDSIRFGADTEMLLRARHALGRGPLEIPLMSMICLDSPNSLSNDRKTGTRAADGRLSKARRTYIGSVKDWFLNRAAQDEFALAFPQKTARYQVSKSMQVPYADIIHNLENANQTTGN